jgi:hypothetical protein
LVTCGTEPGRHCLKRVADAEKEEADEDL